MTMDLIRALILGIVQAITEFLPISSSAHLILTRRWLGFDAVDGLTFDIALHVGTLVAIVVYFRGDIAYIVRSAIAGTGRGRDLALYLVLATIPAALAGFFLDDIIDTVLRRPIVIVFTLVLGGIVFLIAERVGSKTRTLDQLTLREAMLIGVAQALALIPGVSRSGITIVAGMLEGLTRAEAARFTFLLAIPILAGAGLKNALDVRNLALSSSDALVIAVGAVTSALAGWFVIRFLLSFLQRHSLKIFAYYRFALAFVVLVWMLVQRP